MIDKIEKTENKAHKIKDAETRFHILMALVGLKILYGRKYTADITIHTINERIKQDIKKIIKEERSGCPSAEYFNGE